MARIGYNPDRCNELRREAKNLRNKLYRRRVKLKNTGASSSKEQQKLQQEIEKTKSQIDKVNNQVWKCTEQYHDLKISEQSIKRKIKYRKEKLRKNFPNSDQWNKYKSELSKLESDLETTSVSLFKGSPRYHIIDSNFQKLDQRIRTLQKRFLERKELADSGALNAEGKPFKFDRSERMKLIDEIKQLAEKREAIREAIEKRTITYVDHERVEFDEDAVNMIDWSEETIFSYKDVVDNALKTHRYKTVIIIGELIGSFEFSYPSELLLAEQTITEADSEYAPEGSRVYVRITRDNKNSILTIQFFLMEEVTSE